MIKRSRKQLLNGTAELERSGEEKISNAPAETETAGAEKQSETDTLEEEIRSELEKDAFDFLGDEDDISFGSTRERFECACNLIKGLVIRYIRMHSERLLTDTGVLRASSPSAHEVLQIWWARRPTAGCRMRNYGSQTGRSLI